jgi:hypothetical protein
LLRRDLRIDILAKQCGTSTAMIEQHYSHVVPSMFEEELSGVKFEKKEKKGRHINKKSLDIQIEKYKGWEAEYKSRGCIKHNISIGYPYQKYYRPKSLMK